MKRLVDLYKKYAEIINYVIVGGLTTLVSIGAYYLFVYTFLDPNNAFELQLANVLSWICAVVFAYITNRIFVFKSKSKSVVKEITSFVGSRVATLVVDMAIMFLFVTVFRINDKIAKLIVQVIVMILNYVSSKLFVFRKKD